MIGLIRIKQYMALTSGGYRKEMRASLKQSWANAAKFFHLNLRDKRFTKEHALKAGYALRKGEEKGTGTKEFFRSYTGRKLKKFGHMRPLEYTGKTRAAVRSGNISSTSNGGKVAYPGANVFNYHNPFSNPELRPNLEFRRILPEEADLIGKNFNAEINSNWVFNDSRRSYVSIY